MIEITPAKMQQLMEAGITYNAMTGKIDFEYKIEATAKVKDEWTLDELQTLATLFVDNVLPDMPFPLPEKVGHTVAYQRMTLGDLTVGAYRDGGRVIIRFTEIE